MEGQDTSRHFEGSFWVHAHYTNHVSREAFEQNMGPKFKLKERELVIVTI